MFTSKLLLFAFVVWRYGAVMGDFHPFPDDFCDGKGDGDHAHPASCFEFIKCVGEVPHAFFCPENLLWNDTAKQCEWESDKSSCNSRGWQIPKLRHNGENYKYDYPYMGDNDTIRYSCETFTDPHTVNSCPVSRHQRLWSKAFLSCSANDLFDINDKDSYAAKRTCTRKGVSCQRWDTNQPHVHDYLKDRSDLYNLCTSFISSRPWCYTMDPDQRWDYCTVDENFTCTGSSLPNVTGAYPADYPYEDLVSVARYKCIALEDVEPQGSCPVARCQANTSWTIPYLSCSDKECFDPVARTYNGSVECTETGIPCQRWDSSSPHDTYQYANRTDLGQRCILGEEARPWCFTMDPDVEWDYCPVEQCD